ncbi:MAG: molybdenum cofactor biosynthesis protein MoaE [Azoarcus sp.]|jgi:molybdopterin synthase catalytic subunit|nr:molybdenum cofactor biosynthesis protein MoaE [Azoarcus sp.]
MRDPVRLQQEGFSQDEEIRALRAESKRIGGIASFLGCARDFSGEGKVGAIDFDAYLPMALAELQKLRAEAIERFGLIGARIVHRLGNIQAGDDIVFIATAAEHRAPALEACRWLIDELKERVPIWKKEIVADGEMAGTGDQ